MPENWIDVSSHNGVINWKKVRASGIVGAIIRAGYGKDASQQDTQFSVLEYYLRTLWARLLVQTLLALSTQLMEQFICLMSPATLTHLH
jgi:hypothetical protein